MLAKRYIKRITVLALLGCLFCMMQTAQATCYRISYAQGTVLSPSSPTYIATSPANSAVTAVWGSPGIGDGGGDVNAPASININVSSFQPDGTVLASFIAPFQQTGYSKYSSPEQVLFRCDPADSGALYEMYSTNGPYAETGGILDGPTFGIPAGYRSRYQGVLNQLVNVKSGQYFTSYWQQRQLTNLDTDLNGKLLVKVKNFSDVQVNLIRASNETISQNQGGIAIGGDGRAPTSGTGLYGGGTYDYGISYMSFKGGGLGNTVAGTNSFNNYPDYSGSNSSGLYVSAVKYYRTVYINRSATCAIVSATPLVTFPTLAVSQYVAGKYATQTFDVNVSCQGTVPTGMSALVAGIGRGQTAIGFAPQAANYQAAINQGLQNGSGSGVNYLLSDGYATNSTVAKGVGVALYNIGGSPITLASTTTLASGSGVNADGWYPVNNSVFSTSQTAGIITGYNLQYTARLTKLPTAATVTPGLFSASLQVVVRVQ